MALQTGTRLGPYEVQASIGAGGMGEVYKARDSRLGRDVAIKVLPSHLAASPELKQRFEREARAVSSLNHPHICTLYDVGQQDGTDFLVMEYLEGETLARRLEKGPLPLDQALQYAIQVADALDKAHRQGVIHRDLKPGNIMLIPRTGTKLLDFGLAKSTAAQETIAASMTQSSPLTAQGTIVGTMQYMAPEQLEGREADARSDIFSFGAVLYEMVTGRKAFAGKSQAGVIAQIMELDPPPISSLQPMAPPALDRLVRTCLVKNPDERRQTIYDVLLDLKWLVEGGSQAGVPVPVVTRRKHRERLAWLSAAILLVLFLAAAFVAILHLRETPPPAQVMRFQVPLPAKVEWRFSDLPVISPDGRYLVFTGETGLDGGFLFLRALDSVAAQPMPGTQGASLPFWSPDSRSIGFFAKGKLMKVAAAGGPPQTLCEAPAGRGGTWNRDGVIVFAPSPRKSPLYQVSEAGGEARPFTALDASRQETGHVFPSFLPDGRQVIFLVRSAQPQFTGLSAAALGASLESSNHKRIMESANSAVYGPPGYLLFPRGPVLMAQAFNWKNLEFSGTPFPLVEDVAAMAAYGRSAYSVSDNGLLAYRKGSGSDQTQLVWFDRGGKRLDAVGEPGDYSNPSLSPDGKRLAVGRFDPQARTRDIWVFDLERGGASRLTFDPADDMNPVWSSDGRMISFSSERKGRRDIYQKSASGVGADELVFQSDQSNMSLDDWSRDGRWMVYDSGGGGMFSNAVWLAPLFGDRKPVPLVSAGFYSRQGQISPDGKWMAYTSNETGRDEVYVQTFPQPSGRWQVSTAGGSGPFWRRDGRELFFLDGRNMTAVDVKSDAAGFHAGIPRSLFELRLPPFSARNQYVASGDGQRFLVNMPAGVERYASLTVVVSWPAAANPAR